MDDGGPSIISSIFILFFLLLLNAFFSASEMAILSIDKSRLENYDHIKAKRIFQLLKEHSKFLAAVQIGITLTGFLISGYSALYFVPRISDYFFMRHIPYALDISFVLVTIVLTFLILVFGELIPKRIAVNNSYKFAMFAATPLSVFYQLVRPFVYLSSALTNFVLKILGISRSSTSRKLTIEELKSHIEVGREQGIIDDLEKSIIDSAISFDEKLAEEVMTARTEVFAIDIDKPVESYMTEMMQMRYSRIPLYEGDIDNIIGVMYIKDYMLEAYRKGFRNVNIKNVMSPAYFVSERKNISDLFQEMKENRVHLAILIDEYGGFSGLVTMEDLLEEIVGNIEDEYDREEPELVELNPHLFIAQGSLSIKELNQSLNSHFDEEEDYDTLAGLLISELGYIPEDGTRKKVSIQNIEFDMTLIKDRRIRQIMIKIPDNLWIDKEGNDDNNKDTGRN